MGLKLLRAAVSNGGDLFIGLMSGTSIDAIDSALVQCQHDKIALLATHQHAIPLKLRERIAALSQPGANEIEELGVLDRELGELFAQATKHLLDSANTASADVTAIGSHGQTIRHRPASGPAQVAPAFTLQIGDPNTIAECTGITTVADFRRRDIAAGGEGAPLAPAFHAAVLAESGTNRAIINIGGIANISVLQGRDLVQGYDTGPGNTLMDRWIERHRRELFDRDGRWAASGVCHLQLLEKLLRHPYFARSGPRSTGVEEFNLRWLDSELQEWSELEAADVQATLAELTATSIARAVVTSDTEITEVYVCGGGVHNAHLMTCLGKHLAPAVVASTARIGMDPDWVEAATFAWLASQCLRNIPGNAPAVTGALGARVLGGIFPA